LCTFMTRLVYPRTCLVECTRNVEREGGVFEKEGEDEKEGEGEREEEVRDLAS